MSERIGDIVFIHPEPPQQCDACGTIAELRPYGANGEAICYACAMKNPEITRKMMGVKLFGEKP